MICILATIKVKEGKEDLFEKTFIDLSREVRENEKGNIFYQISHYKYFKFQVFFLLNTGAIYFFFLMTLRS